MCGLSLLWIFMWVDRTLFDMKVLQQMWQRYDRSLTVWIFLWEFKTCGHLKRFPQTSQLWGRSTVWVSLCRLIDRRWERGFPQMLQWYFCRPVCSLQWISSCSFRPNDLAQISHLYCFASVCRDVWLLELWYFGSFARCPFNVSTDSKCSPQIPQTAGDSSTWLHACWIKLSWFPWSPHTLQAIVLVWIVSELLWSSIAFKLFATCSSGFNATTPCLPSLDPFSAASFLSKSCSCDAELLAMTSTLVLSKCWTELVRNKDFHKFIYEYWLKNTDKPRITSNCLQTSH